MAKPRAELPPVVKGTRSALHTPPRFIHAAAMRQRPKLSVIIRVDVDKIVRHVLVAALVFYALSIGR
jgi:hypothetical protein